VTHDISATFRDGGLCRQIHNLPKYSLRGHPDIENLYENISKPNSLHISDLSQSSLLFQIEILKWELLKTFIQGRSFKKTRQTEYDCSI